MFRLSASTPGGAHQPKRNQESEREATPEYLHEAPSPPLHQRSLPLPPTLALAVERGEGAPKFLPVVTEVRWRWRCRKVLENLHSLIRSPRAPQLPSRNVSLVKTVVGVCVFFLGHCFRCDMFCLHSNTHR